jgi:hypothetical protein
MMYGNTHVLGATVAAGGAAGAAYSLPVTGLATGGRVLLAVAVTTLGFALTTLSKTARRRAAHQRP